MVGASEDAEGDDMVTDARSRVGLPQDGQNFFDASLHILRGDKWRGCQNSGGLT
jgi:hypothetical protein